MPARPSSPPARLLVPVRRTAVALALLAAAGAAPALAAEEVTVELRSPDGDLWSFPDLFDADGKLLARGTFRQRRTPSAHVEAELVNTFPDGRRVIQGARFDERGPNLVQETMRFEERRGKQVLRSYRADLLGGDAHAVKVEDGKRTEWNEHLEVTPGRTFGGLGLVYAVKNLRERLRGGKELELRGVLMIPKPMAGPMKVRLAGREVIVVGGRRVAADKIELRPPVGPLEKVLAKLKDPPGFDVWVHADDPPMMLRTRQPLFEPKDPVVRLDTLPYAPPRSRQARVPH